MSHTPLELRNQLRAAQRTIRLALNAINKSIDTWEAAIAQGKTLATNLTNDILTQGHISQIPLFTLENIPKLRESAASKLEDQQDIALVNLGQCLLQLQESVDNLHSSIDTVLQLQHQEADSASIPTDKPVFSLLTLETVCRYLQHIADMYSAEVKIKEAVVESLNSIIKNHRSKSAVSGSEKLIEDQLQVHICAWMLSAHIDDGYIDSALAEITRDSGMI